MDIIVPNPYRATVLGDMKTADLNTLTVGLLKSPVVPDPNAVLADLTAEEADFTGYARLTGEDFSALLNIDGDQKEMVSGNLLFRATGSAVGNNVYGWFMCDAGATTLLLWGLFDDYVPIASAGDAVSFVVRVGPANVAGAALITD